MKLGYQLWKNASLNFQEEVQEKKTSGRILFLHGMGGTGALWRPLAAGLEDEFEVLAPDQRGHGKSQVPQIPGDRIQPTFSPLDYGKDVIETLQSLDFHPTWVVGHSMGVRTACAVAHLRPEWVCGLVLIDLGFSGAAGGGLGEELATFLKILPMEFSTRAEARSFMEQHCPDPSIGQYLMAVSKPTQEGRLTFPFDKAALIQTIHSARDVSVQTWAKDLASRGMPIHVLRGETSQVWSHADFEKEKEAFQAFPNVVFEEVPGCGHGLPFEKRVWLTGKLKEWLSSSV